MTTYCRRCMQPIDSTAHVCLPSVAMRPALHPTTRALLAALKLCLHADGPRDGGAWMSANSARQQALVDWLAAGCPDAEEKP